MYKIVLHGRAKKDIEKVKQSALFEKLTSLVEALKEAPYAPPFEKLKGNRKEYFSRRINKQHRLVYNVNDETNTITILSCWSHYE